MGPNLEHDTDITIRYNYTISIYLVCRDAVPSNQVHVSRAFAASAHKRSYMCMKAHVSRTSLGC